MSELKKFEECIYRITTMENRVASLRSLMFWLDSKGYKSDVNWNNQYIKYPEFVFLKCNKDGFYVIHVHDCDYKKYGFMMYEWPPESLPMGVCRALLV